MAVTTRTTLVLRGASVLGDGKTVVVRLGAGYPASLAQPPASPVSMRHPSPACLDRFTDPANPDANTVRGRAGRPAGCAGVLGRRSPALQAGGIGQWCRSQAMGGSRLTAAWCFGPTRAKTQASAGEAIPGRSRISESFAERTRIPPVGMRSQSAYKRSEITLDRHGPADGTPTASTRGKGVS
jgi:hypothetical protein